MSVEPVRVADLTVDGELYGFLVDEVLPPLGCTPTTFFEGLADALAALAPRNRELLALRQRMQDAIDRWHDDHADGVDVSGYRALLEDLGYLVPVGPPFQITTSGVDDEITRTNGPQLVVPVTNARYAINAVNARWGSLYDALYGTDALGDLPPDGPYDPARGARVIAWVRTFLDDAVPLGSASHLDCVGYSVVEGRLIARLARGGEGALRDGEAFAGYTGDPAMPSSVLLRNHGLLVELVIDRDDPVGATDVAGLSDVRLEAAITTIVDFEDSVATVDPADKVAAYRNWLGLMDGTLEAVVEKQGASFVRRLDQNRPYRTPDGGRGQLRARALMLARTVGHLMTTTSVLDQHGEPVPEGILDTFVVAAIGGHDRLRPLEQRNSRFGAIYIVKPKMHGPDEVTFACEVLAMAEHTLGLPADTIKIGIMDEERRTTLNLEECVRAASTRVVFINTGFLDRTGDEIHTSMRAGPMVRKADMRSTAWIRAYEDSNVAIGLRCGFAGRAQIGKGMWAMPDRMQDLLAQKIGHPRAGANCAWVPSPAAATLHATHYHCVDVDARQQELAGATMVNVAELLRLPIETNPTWSERERQEELDNNLQGILGYAVRWIDQGIGCSKVLDINRVALMEDRATCRISSQHVANWLLHGMVSRDQVEESLRRMALVVDEQNANDPTYRPMAPSFDGPAFQSARDLVFDGTTLPSGYTEPVLHARRLERKDLDRTHREGTQGSAP